MSYFSSTAWWWPYLFILAAGFAATDIWRFLGVYFGGKLSEDSDLLMLVRTMATALVAAVIGNLIVFPAVRSRTRYLSSVSPRRAWASLPTCCRESAWSSASSWPNFCCWRGSIWTSEPRGDQPARAALIFSAFAASTSGFSISPLCRWSGTPSKRGMTCTCRW